ncbi:hypothetical protein J6590_090522 [Homalodisca vitripennis]|nr:hypothetical protein J6590_090522 [Homalodisca vitripennis]
MNVISNIKTGSAYCTLSYYFPRSAWFQGHLGAHCDRPGLSGLGQLLGCCLGRALPGRSQWAGVHLIVCILTEYKRPVWARRGRSQLAGIHLIAFISTSQKGGPVTVGGYPFDCLYFYLTKRPGQLQWVGVHLIVCIYKKAGPGQSQWAPCFTILQHIKIVRGVFRE